jgi:hypothetical protein
MGDDIIPIFIIEIFMIVITEMKKEKKPTMPKNKKYWFKDNMQ